MIQEFKCRDIDHKEYRIFISERNLEEKKKRLCDNPRIITLCAECAWKFHESPWYSIRRINPFQLDFKTCHICKKKPGYCYEVEDLNKRRVNKDNIIVV